VSFPASFTLVAALNPCSCGFYGDPERDCTCPPQQVSRYQRRISGPLLDRIDLFVDVPRVPYEKLMGAARGEPSADVAHRIGVARGAQRQRFADVPGARLNADMNASEVRTFVQLQLTPEATTVLKLAVERLNLSARGFHRVLKVARTIADLAGSTDVEAVHLAEAVQYRERIE
jgi:magnesium chelatase family protein